MKFDLDVKAQLLKQLHIHAELSITSLGRGILVQPHHLRPVMDDLLKHGMVIRKDTGKRVHNKIAVYHYLITQKGIYFLQDYEKLIDQYMGGIP